MSAIIGALRVVLSAETAQFEKGMKDAQSRLKTFSMDIGKMAAGVTAAFAGVAAATALAVRSTLKEADNLTKMGRAIGVPVEQLSALKHAAEDSGVSLENLSKGMQTLANNMAKAASDAKSETALAFNAIGIAVRDATGQLRPSAEVMLDIAQKFSRLQDGAAKSALAVRLFGDAGTQMITMLNQGRGGITALMQEARELGIVISKETGEAAERFHGTLDRLNKIKQSLWVQITAKLAPALELLAQRMLTSAKEGNSVESAVGKISAAFEHAVVVAERALATFRVFMSVARNFWEFIKDPVNSDAPKKLREEYDEIVKTYRDSIAELRGIAATADMAKLLGIEGIGPKVAKEMAPVVKSTREVAEALAAARAEVQAFVATRNDGIDDFAKKFQAIRDAFKAGTLNLAQYTQMMGALQRQLDEFKRSEARDALTDLIGEATVSTTEKMQALKQALDNGTISMTEYGRTMKRINEENKQHMHDMAGAVSSALTTIFAKSKTAAIAAAIINTAQGISRNLAQYPQPIAGIMAAITAATGAAQIRAIRSTNMGSGGGGSGAAAAAPATPTAPMQQSLLVQGLNPGDLFRGEQVAELAKKLLEFQKLGGVVVLQ